MPKEAKVTVQMAEQLGDLVGRGVKPEFAVARITPQISLEHWTKNCKRSTRLASAYMAGVAAHVERLVDRINSGERNWQSAAWLLERVQGYINKMLGGTQVNIQVNTCLGLSNDIAQRARTFVVSESKVKRIRDATPE